jgi:hypothetical protein
LNFWAWHKGMFELHSGCGAKKEGIPDPSILRNGERLKSSGFRKDVCRCGW